MFWQRITIRDFIDEFDSGEKSVGSRFILSFVHEIRFAVRPNEPISIGTGSKFGEQRQQIQTSLRAIQLLTELKRNRQIFAQGRRRVESRTKASLDRT